MSQECEECFDGDVANGNLRWCSRCRDWVEGLHGSFLCVQCTRLTSLTGPKPATGQVARVAKPAEITMTSEVQYLKNLVASLRMEAAIIPAIPEKEGELYASLRLMCKKFSAAADAIEALQNKIAKMEAKVSNQAAS